MKRLFLSAIILATFSFNSCNELADIEISKDIFKWEVSSPDELGLNSNMLNSALSEASSKGFINSIIVICDGKIAAEKYFNGGNVNRSQTIRSVSKSFLSALIGIAVSKEFLISIKR